MRIEWAALGIVAVVSVVATVVFTTLLAAGIRLVSRARVANESPTFGARAVATRTAGFTLLALAGLVVLFGLYLIVPGGR
ncbi:MAG: hypothetical protein L0H41_12685 [Microlunatus sp.]|nr:hypothetical protein [Microlunatus sp.]MDN5804059.1 hypothetical protein [Microlunatus sp.]